MLTANMHIDRANRVYLELCRTDEDEEIDSYRKLDLCDDGNLGNTLKDLAKLESIVNQAKALGLGPTCLSEASSNTLKPTNYASMWTNFFDDILTKHRIVFEQLIQDRVGDFQATVEVLEQVYLESEVLNAPQLK